VISDGDLPRLLAEFAHILGTDFSVETVLDHLVRRIVEILPVAHACVMLMGETHQELRVAAAGSEAALRIGSLEHQLGEGPCTLAYLSGEPVLITGVRPDARFPGFSARADETGLAAQFAFPMRLNGDRLGALGLFHTAPVALEHADQQAAQLLADVASAYLTRAFAGIDAAITAARVHHRNLHDPVTGLPNRLLLEELLDRVVARARRSRTQAAVLLVDIEGFKAVNDGYGQHVGDQLLSGVAGRLSRTMRPGDVLARVDGSKFVVVCEDMVDGARPETVAERIVIALSAPFEPSGHKITISAAVGIAFSGPGQDIPEVLMRETDFTTYPVIQNNPTRHQSIAAAPRFAADHRADLERDLRQAPGRHELALVYQPIVDLRTGEIDGVEALVRWRHPIRGTVMPATILPAAERAGMIGALGEWVLGQGCRDLRHWRTTGLDVGFLAINVSTQHLMGPAFAPTLARALVDAEIAPASIFLEFTEDVFLADAGRALAVLREIKDLGVRLSLDDFGVGYSSVSYLHMFPVDVVKIDRAVTAQLTTEGATRPMLHAIIDLGHAFDLTVTVEGVETAEQLTDVTDLGVDHAQGFHLSHPITAEELSRYLGSGIGQE